MKDQHEFLGAVVGRKLVSKVRLLLGVEDTVGVKQ